MSDVLREAVLIAATLTTGLMAGVFGIYSNAIMHGLRRTDDRTFVAAFQSIDRAIINPAFMATFLGPLVLTALAAVLHLAGEGRPLLPWIVVALVLCFLVFVITIRVNVPRNNEIKAAGDVDRLTDLHGLRERFDEARGPLESRASVRLDPRVRPARLGADQVRTGALTPNFWLLGRSRSWKASARPNLSSQPRVAHTTAGEKRHES
jgi:uncharacterized membrane protein